MNRLAAGLIRHGVRCTFVLGETGEQAAGQHIPAGVEVVVAKDARRSLSRALGERIAESPAAELVVLPFRTVDYSWVVNTRSGRMADRARIFLVNGAYISERLSAPGLAGWKARRRLRRDWARAEGIITTCPEIQADWRATGAFAPDRIHAPHPPVVGSDVDALAGEPVEHPWINGTEPVVLAAGRLNPNKRFELLLEAFARLRSELRAKLIILGRGNEEQRLRRLCAELGITRSVDFPGYTANPYAWMRHANVFVLPSRIEPFGLVLIESLYVGTPFIAAGTPPGPRAIHNATGCGHILEHDAPDELAAAIQQELAQPSDPVRLRRAAAVYDSDSSAGEHMEILFPGE